MSARTVRRISFWIGMAAAATIPAVPYVYRVLYPSQEMKMEETAWGLAASAWNAFNAMGDGIVMMVWMCGFAAAAALASLMAFVAAWIARESRRTKWLCGLPVLLVA